MPITRTWRASRSASSSSWACASFVRTPAVRFSASRGRPVWARPLWAGRSRARWAASSSGSRSEACAMRRRSGGIGAPTWERCRAASFRGSSRRARAIRSSCSTSWTSWDRTSGATHPRPCSRCSTRSRIRSSATTSSTSRSICRACCSSPLRTSWIRSRRRCATAWR